MPQAVAVSLANLGNGLALERFNHELKRVLANMKDPNTDSKKKRTITLTVTLTPHGDRVGASVDIDCNSKLATVPSVAAGTIFMLRDSTGPLEAFSHDIRQEQLFKEPDPPAEAEAATNVVPMTAKQA